jgi:hypothetical protein
MAAGLSHTTKALTAMPTDTSNALALGFRNAPRLYGDQTVPFPPHKITGTRSGLRAASSKLFLGFYDGVVGLVRLPTKTCSGMGQLGW